MSTNILIILVLFIFCSGCKSSDSTSTLNIVDDKTLRAYYDKQHIDIATVKYFYGYGMLDEHRVFYAYQGPDAEASALIKVYNLKNRSETFLYELPGSGETSFMVHPETKNIIFNDFYGIKILKVYSDDTYTQRTVIRSEGNLFVPYWIDERTIGYTVFERDKKIKKRMRLGEAVDIPTIDISEKNAVFFTLNQEEFDSLAKDPNSGIDEVVSDFDFYTNKIQKELSQMGITSQYTSEKAFNLRYNNGQTYFFDRDDMDHVVGMLISDGIRTPYLITGVYTNFGLIAEINEYFEISP